MNFNPFKSSKSPLAVWLQRIFKNARENMMRSKLLTTATILIISLIFFVFNLMLALNIAAESVIEQVGEKLDVSVEVRSEVENYTVQTFVQTLKKRPEVKEVVYVDKDEALSRFGKKYPNVISFLDRHQLENPLPGTIRIVTSDVGKNNALIDFLQQPQFNLIINQQKLSGNLEQKVRNEKILNITEFIKKTGIWLNIVFALVTFLIIFNSININIHTHKKEIHIMKLVGAKHHFIRGGFILEGVFYAVFGLLISFGLSKIILSYLTKNLLTVISNENLLAGLNAILFHFEDGLWLTFGWQLLAATLAGLISSYLAIELYLKKKNLF